MTGFANASTAALQAIERNLLGGLDAVAERLADGTFDTCGPKGAAPPSQSGRLTLALLAGVTAELADRQADVIERQSDGSVLQGTPEDGNGGQEGGTNG